MGAVRREELVSRVLRGAAEAVTLDDLGREVLPHLGALLGAATMMLYRSQRGRPFAFVAGSDACLPEYVARFAHDDPVQHALRRDSPRVFTAAPAATWRPAARWRALADFYDRWELSRLFHVRLNGVGHMQPGYTAIVCGRGARQRRFGERELGCTAAVLPALSAAVRRAGRLEPRLAAIASVEALLERASTRALVVLDLDGTHRWCSARAERLLAPYLRAGATLPESALAAARRLGALARREAAAADAASFRFCVRGADDAELEAEAYLGRTAGGESFVAIDLGGDGVAPRVVEVARRHGLTRAETEILSDLARGWSDAEIAGRRFVSIPTVRTHVTRILGKCRVSSRLKAVALALGTLEPATRD